MTRRTVQISGPGHPLLDIHSLGRPGPQSRPFTAAEIQQIARTVRRTPEAMVKVTGGGAKVGTVAAHLQYISRDGDLEIETDDAERVRNRDEQKQLLQDWHLELTAGHFRKAPTKEAAHRKAKLVHNIVLSMPSPTPADKVLLAARRFAREKFGGQHRYAMVLHTDQKHPHVHMVVKAESEYGRRLHINKEMLREWREDFAQRMREQGVAANATRRSERGQTKSGNQDAILRAARRRASVGVREPGPALAPELSQTCMTTNPWRTKLREIRKTAITRWSTIADALDAQGEASLASEVRQFARSLPQTLSPRERLDMRLLGDVDRSRSGVRATASRSPDRADDFTQ